MARIGKTGGQVDQYPPALITSLGDGLGARRNSSRLIAQIILSHRPYGDLVTPPRIIFLTAIMFPAILDFLLLIVSGLYFPLHH